MPVKHITTIAELKQLTESPRLTVVKGSAAWCGPCRNIAPFVDELSRKYPLVNFVHVDVDEAEEVAKALSIRAMPTFVFFKQQKEVDRMEGASPDALEQKVKEHGANVSFEGQGHRLGDAATSAEKAQATTAASQQQGASGSSSSLQPSSQTSSREWPLEVRNGETAGKVLLQTADGTRNPLKIAPERHTVADLYRGIGQMLEKGVDSFYLSSRDGMKTVQLKSDDTTTLKEAKVAGGVVLMK